MQSRFWEAHGKQAVATLPPSLPAAARICALLRDARIRGRATLAVEQYAWRRPLDVRWPTDRYHAKCNPPCYTLSVIRTFRHRGLQTLFETGRSAQIRPDLRARCLRKLDVIDNAATLAELRLPGFAVHPLKGKKVGRFAISVNGPWRITLKWTDGDAYRVDLEPNH